MTHSLSVLMIDFTITSCTDCESRWFRRKWFQVFRDARFRGLRNVPSAIEVERYVYRRKHFVGIRDAALWGHSSKTFFHGPFFRSSWFQDHSKNVSQSSAASVNLEKLKCSARQEKPLRHADSYRGDESSGFGRRGNGNIRRALSLYRRNRSTCFPHWVRLIKSAWRRSRRGVHPCAPY